MLSRLSLLLLLLSLAVAPSACWLGGEDVASSEDALTFQPKVKGSVDGRIRDLTPREVEALRFVSHDKIPTWEGVVADYGRSNETVHLVDTKRFDGHFGYTKNALGRGSSFTENNFFTEIQYPRTRRYMPFLVFDFRSAPLQVDGKQFRWVMNVRRYNYRDTESELATMLVHMRDLLAEHLMKTYGEPVLFVYDSDHRFPSTNTLRRPHLTELRKIRERGFNHVVTEGDMIRLAGGNLVSVLNPGTAYGYLTLVKAHVGGTIEEGEPTREDERLTPRHIAIFEDTPERIPPVSGIVTLEPQTPLSHVNLLAKNRKTPNVSTMQIGLIPGLEPLIGKLVKMVASPEGAIHFSEADIEDATRFWESSRARSLDVPKVEPLGTDAVEFANDDDLPKQLINNIGSKAANYAVIQKILGPTLVKPGFALGFAHYRALVKDSPADALIADLIAKKDSLPPEEVDARLKAIRKAIKTSSPASALQTAAAAAVRAIQARLPGIPRLRFRSSTNSEDLPVFNGAGLYESKGFDVADDDAKLHEELLDVMASLWLERAFWERELFGIKHAEVAMAILVNPAFSDEYGNGVVVGSASAAGFSSWVNAQRGEASVTNPLHGEVPESFTIVGNSVAVTKLDSRSNIENIFLANGSDIVRPELESQLRQLHQATETLQKHFVSERRAEGDELPYAIDIEYKLMQEAGALRLWIKQSRLLAL